MKYITQKDILIPAGTEIRSAPQTTINATRHGEAVLGFGKDQCASIVFDEELMQDCPEIFYPGL